MTSHIAATISINYVSVCHLLSLKTSWCSDQYLVPSSSGYNHSGWQFDVCRKYRTRPGILPIRSVLLRGDHSLLFLLFQTICEHQLLAPSPSARTHSSLTGVCGGSIQLVSISGRNFCTSPMSGQHPTSSVSPCASESSANIESLLSDAPVRVCVSVCCVCVLISIHRF